MNLVIFWTDGFIYGMVALLFCLFLFRKHNLQWELVWRRMFSQSRYVISLIILVFFGFIGLLDTVHLKRAETQHQVVSVLDLLFGSRAWQSEVSYSAPFALHSYVAEMRVSEEGQFQEGYPRLEYAGQHLSSEKEKIQDIMLRILKGLFIGILIGGLLFLALDRFIFRKVRILLNDSVGSDYCVEVISEISGIALTSTSSIALKNVKMAFWVTMGGVISLVCICAALLFEYHILGTDKVGRDVFYIAIKSIRTGLVIGTLTTLVSLPFALILGMFAGYFRGLVDDAIQYLYITLSSVPGVLLIAAAVLSLQAKIEQDPDLRLLVLCLILGITSWTTLCRLLRGETLKLREAEFLQAAKALGVGEFKSIWRHILPNLLHIVVIVLVLDFSGLVLAEAVLTYVGVGVDPLTHSWGNMINIARLEMARDPIVWWSLAGALVLMFALVFSANIVSEAVQDALNPRSE